MRYVYELKRHGTVIDHVGCAAEIVQLYEENVRLAEALTPGEPVAWRMFDGEGGYDYRDELPDEKSRAWSARYGRKWEPLYTAPQPQPKQAFKYEFKRYPEACSLAEDGVCESLACPRADDTALLRQALEALEFHSHGDDIDVLLIAALRERLK
jgi:hypothetical protein